MKILDGRKVRDELQQYIKNDIFKLNKNKIFPKLIIIQIGKNVASDIYIKNKQCFLEKNKILSEVKYFKDTDKKNVIINFIKKCNVNKKINGILLQLPLPNGFDANELISYIANDKDVDCLTQANVGKIWTSTKHDNNTLLYPCTPFGILKILEYYKIKVEGKNIVIVGRSNIVGKPLAALLLHNNATITICHTKTKNLSSITKTADILISATGHINLIDERYVNKKQIIIDVGSSKNKEGKIVGDINFNRIKNKIYAITPVPGGVGPMTIYGLAHNLILLTKQQNNIK